MPTIVEIALLRIEDLARRAFGPAAAAWIGSDPVFRSVGEQQSIAHRYNTPIVNLMQHGYRNFLKKTPWIVSSYPPTAACLGMANLLGVKRIVYRDRLGKPISYDVQTFTPGPTAQAFQAQFDRKDYPAENPPGPSGASLLADPNQTVQASFRVDGGAQALIADLQGADETARDNCGVMLAFAIANIAHGGLNANPNRSAAFLGQNVASVMVDSNWRIIRWGLNNNKANSTFHGETNAVQEYQRANRLNTLPASGRLYTTLEPCAMCSGILVHCAGSNPFTVVCGQRDAQVAGSALRSGGRVDGETGNGRTVDMLFAEAMLTHRSRISETLSTQQTHASVSLPKPQPTTRFLEDRGQPTFGDVQLLLEKSAAVWIPQAQRVHWRTNLTQFLQTVRATVG